MQLETPLAPRDEKEMTGPAAIVTSLNMPVLVRQVVVGGGVVAGKPLLNIEVGLDSAVAVRGVGGGGRGRDPSGRNVS